MGTSLVGMGSMSPALSCDTGNCQDPHSHPTERKEGMEKAQETVEVMKSHINLSPSLLGAYGGTTDI